MHVEVIATPPNEDFETVSKHRASLARKRSRTYIERNLTHTTSEEAVEICILGLEDRIDPAMEALPTEFVAAE